MLTAYIRDLRREPTPPALDAMWDGALPTDTPDAIARLVHQAERFSCAANGAALLYNLMLAEARSGALASTDGTSADTYRQLLDEWAAVATRVQVSKWAANMDEFWQCVLERPVRIPPATRLFLDAWSNLLASNTGKIPLSADARDLIRAREMQHKRGQARLANRKRLDEWAGYAGTSPLVFRWPQVQRMLRDIAGGLNEPLTADDHAVA